MTVEYKVVFEDNMGNYNIEIATYEHIMLNHNIEIAKHTSTSCEVTILKSPHMNILSYYMHSLYRPNS